MLFLLSNLVGRSSFVLNTFSLFSFLSILSLSSMVDCNKRLWRSPSCNFKNLMKSSLFLFSWTLRLSPSASNLSWVIIHSFSHESSLTFDNFEDAIWMVLKSKRSRRSAFWSLVINPRIIEYAFASSLELTTGLDLKSAISCLESGSSTSSARYIFFKSESIASGSVSCKTRCFKSSWRPSRSLMQRDKGFAFLNVMWNSKKAWMFLPCLSR